MTNLSDDEVKQYERLQARREQSTPSRAALSFPAALSMSLQAACLLLVAAMTLKTSRVLDDVTQRPIVLTPETDTTLVPKKVLFVGKISDDDERPVVLVRPLTERNTWWVQDPVEVNSQTGTFRSVLSIGDDTTAPGTLFVVAVVKNNEMEKKWKPGARIYDLQGDLESQITVVRK